MEEQENKVWFDFVKGDKKAFTHIYSLNVDSLFSYGMKIFPNRDFVKDCIQDAFLDIYDHRNQLSTPRNIRHYLFVVLKRTMFRRLKKEKKKDNPSQDLELSFNIESSIESKTIDREVKDYQKKLIEKITKELSAKQQEILYLRFNKGFNYIEISEIVNIDHNSVRKQVYRAIKKLRKNYGHNDVFNVLMFFSTL